MTQEEIIKGNNLIAEFMEYEIAGTDGDTSAVLAYYFPDNHPTHTGMVSADSLLFNSSWDWLMPVVGKIKENYSVSLSGCSSIKHNFMSKKEIAKKLGVDMSDVPPIAESVNGLSLNGIYLLVLEFINWYNKTKKEI